MGRQEGHLGWGIGSSNPVRPLWEASFQAVTSWPILQPRAEGTFLSFSRLLFPSASPRKQRQPRKKKMAGSCGLSGSNVEESRYARGQRGISRDSRGTHPSQSFVSNDSGSAEILTDSDSQLHRFLLLTVHNQWAPLFSRHLIARNVSLFPTQLTERDTLAAVSAWDAAGSLEAR